MPVIPNMGDSMAAPHLLRTLPRNRVHPSGLLGPSRPVPGGLAHLRVMKTKKAEKALDNAPKAQVLSVVEGVLSLSELCAQLQVGTQTIYDLRSQGRGPRGFRPHRLRHTAAHRWLAAGGSESGLMAIAGWTRTDMLVRYTRARPQNAPPRKPDVSTSEPSEYRRDRDFGH
jgi:hypothetical protein